MKKNARIYLNDIKNGENNLLAVTDGFVEKTDQSFAVEFKFERDTMIVAVNADLVSINRIGEAGYMFIMQQGKSSDFTVSTPFGSAGMSIFTNSVFTEYNDKELHLKIDFTLFAADDKHRVDNMLYLKCELQ